MSKRSDPEAPWREAGHQLRLARERARLGAREAAKRADIGDSTWRFVEKAERPAGAGRTIPYHVSRETLLAMAEVLAIDPAPLCDLLGFPYDPNERPLRADPLRGVEEALQQVRDQANVALGLVQAARSQVPDLSHAGGSVAGR